MPKISVIMPVHNGERYLKEALQSVLSQTYSDFECLIIDDGSTDSSSEIIKSFDDSRLVYLPKSYSGIVDTLNYGIAHSKGEYVARFDCDDFCYPQRFEEQVRFLDINPQYAVVGSYAMVIDENGKEVGNLEYPPLTARHIKSYTLLHNPFIHSSVMLRKNILDTVGAYRKSYKHVEDYELWTRIVFSYPCANLNIPLIRYRIHSNQITKKNNLSMRFRGFLVRMLALFRFLF